MDGNAGLWIDHDRAVITFLSGEEEKVVIVESNLKEKFRAPADKSSSNPNGRRNKIPDDLRSREFSEHLSVFFDEVIVYLRKADAIAIFGPGEAKHELVKRMKKTSLDSRVRCVETAGKMTYRQMVAKVRTHFHTQKSRMHGLRGMSHNIPITSYLVG